MITHIIPPTPFAAPIGLLIAGILADVPRYEREKDLASVSRSGSMRLNPAMTKQAAALRAKILDVIRNAPLVIEAISGTKADVNTIADAVQGKRSTVYKALYYMLDLGLVSRASADKMSSCGRRCVEWVVTHREVGL